MRAEVKAIFCAVMFFLTAEAYAFDGYGVCASPFTREDEKIVPEAFDLLEKAGVKWARLGFRWDEIEPTKGVYDFSKNDRLVKLAQKHNIKVLGLINRTPVWASGAENTISPPKDIEDWKNFVITVVTRYKGKVAHWEAWNEPDIKKFWTGSPEEYITLLKTAYRVIKSIDPSMKVVSAGLDGNAEKGKVYLESLLKLGMTDYCDIIAFHPYGKTPERSLQRVIKFREILDKYSEGKPLWLTEVGWQSGGWPGGPAIVENEQVKAKYLKESFSLLKPHADAIFWYRAIEGPRMYGLIELDKSGKITPTPAYNAYKDMVNKR